jgi:hypothetical protein
MSGQQSEMRTQASWPSKPRPSSDAAMADAAVAALNTAAGLARAGDRQRARELCAAIVFDMQPLIAARAELLRAVLRALLMAHGFKLLSRVAMAVVGRSIEIVVLPDRAGPIALPRLREEQGRTICTLDPRWLNWLSPDDMFLRQWCDSLMTRRHRQADLPATAPSIPPGIPPSIPPGTAPASRQLEQV